MATYRALAKIYSVDRCSLVSDAGISVVMWVYFADVDPATAKRDEGVSVEFTVTGTSWTQANIETAAKNAI